MINLHNIDCNEFMKSVPDKFYDLAIVDPVYFKGVADFGFYGAPVSNTGVTRKDFKIDTEIWDNNIPDERYLKELVRVSKNQIIWGINYYDFNHCKGRIVWDKKNDHTSFSHCEIASCSLHDSVKIFRWQWCGMIRQGEMNTSTREEKIHPTQKPIQLYEWLLLHYAKAGHKILDTHMGSGSSVIACDRLGFDVDACEIDKNMFIAAGERIQQHQKQLVLI